MKLSDWLQCHNVTRVDFARRTGLSPSAVTQLCNNYGAWLSRETAAVIMRETKGAVTPNDFMSSAAEDAAESDASVSISSVQEAIDAFSKGEMVVVTDDDDRENEGDIFVAASKCSPEKMAFIIRHTSGIVCAPLSQERARQLSLDPMVAVNDAPLGTAFTVSVDFRDGLTTGISADERTATVRALANGNTGPRDFVRPGHVFPLIARNGGVLMRSGHTEACVDMCRLASLPQVGVLAELTHDDGTVMRGRAVAQFAARHGLHRISVADLIAYRQARERLVTRLSSSEIETAYGLLVVHGFSTPFDDVHHFAFVLGDIGSGRNVPARLHRANVAADLFGGNRTLDAAMLRFNAEGRGVLVYLRDGAAGVPLLPQVDAGASSDDKRMRQWREIGLGAQILRDLGIATIRNFVTRPQSYVALSGFGIEIVETEFLE